MEDSEEMQVKELLMKSPDHMRSAIAIESSINEVKRDLLERVFKEIENKVEENKLNNEYDYESSNSKKINDFYRYSSKFSYPGISYLYKSNLTKDIDIWVRFEIEWGPYIGFCTSKEGKLVEDVFSDQQIEKLFNVEAINDGHWLYYEWLPENDEDVCPDFKSLDDYYLNLYADKNFDDFTTACANKIKEFLSK